MGDVDTIVQRPLKDHKPLKEEWKRYDTKHSPFLELQTPFTGWEVFKLLVLLPWLLPRLLIALLSLMILAMLSGAAALGWPLEEPMPPWRRRLVTLSANFAGVVVFMLGFRTRISGYENYAKGKELGAIGLFNHTSWVDAIVIMWLFAPSGVSKASNADIPLVGTCIRGYQNIYVSRASIENAKGRANNGAESVSQKIAKRAKDRRFPMLFMAPEGTCGDGRCVLRFRTGAFVPGVPVLPVCLSYNKSYHNPAWTIMNLGWHFLRLCCQFENTLDATVLPPYVPSGEERGNPGLYAKNVQALYAKTLGVPIVDQSQEEFTALFKRGITVSLDGRRVEAPPGIVDSDGLVDLTTELPQRDGKKKRVAKKEE